MVEVLMVKYLQFTVDHQLLMDLDQWELTVQIFMVKVLMVNSWQFTVDLQLLMVKCQWIWTIKREQTKSWWYKCWWSFIIVKLLTVTCWSSTIVGEVLMDSYHQEWTGQILMVQELMIRYHWSSFDSPLLTINYCGEDLNFQELTVEILIVDGQLWTVYCWLSNIEMKIWIFKDQQSKSW